jgi:hypothetical protein
MKKFISHFLLFSCTLWSGALAFSQETTDTPVPYASIVRKGETSEGPIEHANTSVKVKENGIFEVNYTMDLLQLGSTTAHVKLGFLIRHKGEKNQSKKSEYYAVTPQTYVIDPESGLRRTKAHCEGKALLRLSKGDVVHIGILKVPVSPTRPTTLVNRTTISLKKMRNL